MRIAAISLLSLAVLASGADAQNLYRWVDKSGKVHYSDQPPPKDIKKVEQPNLKASTIATSGLSYEAQRAAQNFPVTLYTSPDCVAECTSAREFLTSRGIPFTERRVVTREDGDKFKQALKVEQLLFPTVTVGSQQQIGFEKDTWHSLLDVAGYPRTPVPNATSAAPAATAPSPAPAAR